MNTRRTRLLALLIVAASAAAVVCYGRMTKLRDDAAAAVRDLSACRRYASELGPPRVARPGAADRSAPGGSGLSSTASDPEMNRRIRDAAAGAGIPDRLVGIEPGEPRHVAGGDYDELLVFLRFDAVSLKDLTTFLHRLAASDSKSRAKSIELASPSGPTAAVAAVGPAPPPDLSGTAELWSADVTLAYFLRAARISHPLHGE